MQLSQPKNFLKLCKNESSAGKHVGYTVANDTNSDLFTQAIELDPSNHVLYSNRSACHASMKNFDAALSDAEKTTGRHNNRKGWLQVVEKNG